MGKIVLVLLVAMLLVLTACSEQPETVPTGHALTTFKEAATSDAVILHPYLSTDSASSSYQGLLYAGGLMERDPVTLDFVPNMAESWAISEDGLTYTFKLREGMLWTDGEEITAYDFKWTFDQMMKPENDYPYIGSLDFIESYEATGRYEITVKIKEPFCPALEGVDAVTPLPRHVWEGLDWKDPSKNPQIMHPTVTSGPYKLVEWQREVHAVFEANDTYWKGRPKIDRYTVRIIPEQAIAYTMLLSGEVDQAPLLPEQYDEVGNNELLNRYEFWLARGSWAYIGFNLRRPHLQDIRVRHALNYALYKSAMLQAVMKGLAQRQPSTIVPSNPYYNENVPFYLYNRIKANKLLTEAGYPPDPEKAVMSGNIYPHRPNFPKLKLIYGPQSNKVRQKLAVIIQDYYKKIGIDVEIQSYEWSAYLEALKKEPYDWDLCIGGWNGTINPHWMEQLWFEETIPQLNHVAYINPDVEAMFKQASQDCDRQDELYDEIQYIIAVDSPYIFLWQNMSFSAINKRVKGIKPSVLGLGYDLHEWYIEE